MEVILAKKYGFCFGVKRAVRLTEKTATSGADTVTLGHLIHNPVEIERLRTDFGVLVSKDISELKEGQNVIIRTHGIVKKDLEILKNRNVNIIDATCPYVSKPQQIVEKMSNDGYDIVIFGDKEHPEIQGIMSYSNTTPIVISSVDELKAIRLPKKVAIVSQTTKQISKFNEVINYLVIMCHEIRIFNTICNATFENQDAAFNLSKKADIMIVVGGKISSNSKQLLLISKQNCNDSYLVENEDGLEEEWFKGKNVCGVTAGASTPDWIVQRVIDKIKCIRD